MRIFPRTPCASLRRSAALFFLMSFVGAAMAADGDAAATAAVPASPVMAPATLLVPEWTVPTLGRPVDPGYLGDLRGGVDLDEDAVDALINVDGTVTDNTADNVVTGSNIIRDGSFANASGLNTVIQNTGANVLIQNATIVQVDFADPLP